MFLIYSYLAYFQVLSNVKKELNSIFICILLILFCIFEYQNETIIKIKQ